MISLVARHLTLSLVLCLALPGCVTYEKMFGDPEQFSHRPAMVMFVNDTDISSDRARVTIDFTKINIGGYVLSDILEKARNWRLSVFTLDGTYLDGKDWNSDSKAVLEKLPVNKLLRADLDIHAKSIWKSEESETAPDAKVTTKSFLVLLHKYPE